MDSVESKYSFRRRDYNKIRNWYELSRKNYSPIQQEYSIGLRQNQKTYHFRFQFRTITLNEVFINENIKDVSQISKVVILSSLYKTKEGLILAAGKEISIECQFSTISFVVDLKETVTYLFYVQEKPSHYQLFLEIQMITKEGHFKKIGVCRFPLPMTDTNSQKLQVSIINNLFNTQFAFGKEKQTVTVKKIKSKSKIKLKNKPQQTQTSIGYIDMSCSYQYIKEIQKFLPSLKIIDMDTKISPLVIDFNKKNGLLSIDPSYKVILTELMIKIQQPKSLKRELLINNPFTLIHKELVALEIKEFKLIVDLNNGWKFINEKDNYMIFNLIVEKEYETYLTFKSKQNREKIYYESDCTLLIALCICKVQYTLSGVVHQKRNKQFLLGWLPLPLDLSLKENRIEMLMVNDVQFPFYNWTLLNIKCIFTATIMHPLYQKYKPSHEDKKINSTQPLFPFEDTFSRSNNFFMRNSKTQAVSASQKLERNLEIQQQIQNLKQIVYENQMSYKQKRLIKVLGRAELGQVKKRHETQISMQQTVGKVLKVSLQINSIVPQTNCPSIYYLPRNMKCIMFFGRETRQFEFRITQDTIRFGVPVRINLAKTEFVFKNYIDSVYQFDEMLNSKLVIALFEQDSEFIYCKSTQDTFEVLGSAESDKILFVRIGLTTEQGYKIFGSLLLKVSYELQKPKSNQTNVSQYQIDKSINFLSAEERLRMRIGNFKGDSDVRTKTIAKIKDKKRSQLIANIVDNELECDGEIVYQIGVDRYHLAQFINLDKSENNVFTFHLSCPYAELVTDQQQYRTIVQSLNVQVYNFHKIQFVYKQNLSFYQTNLSYNQSLGLLIKMNASQYCESTRNLTKIQLLIKRNTLLTKKIKIKCRYKAPFIWDIYSFYEIYQRCYSQRELRMKICFQMIQSYKDIQVLHPHIKYDSKTNEIVFLKHSNKMYQLLISAYLKDTNLKVMIMYRINFVLGEFLNVEAGKKYRLSIPVQLKYPIQILRSLQKQVIIYNVFTLKFKEKDQEDILIQCLKPFEQKMMLISSYDVSGNKLFSYAYKVQSKISSMFHTQQVYYDSILSVIFQNPYACLSAFSVISSNSALDISEVKLKLQAYGSRILACKLVKDCDEGSVYVYVLDINGNVVHTTVFNFILQNDQMTKDV